MYKPLGGLYLKFNGIGLLIRVGGEATKVRSPHDELTGQSNTISNL